MKWPWTKPIDAGREIRNTEMARRRRRDEAMMDRVIEAMERAAFPCVDCEIGEPHVCERAWWQQKADHLHGRECSDPECVCHPETCPTCHQPVPLVPVTR